MSSSLKKQGITNCANHKENRCHNFDNYQKKIIHLHCGFLKCLMWQGIFIVGFQPCHPTTGSLAQAGRDSYDTVCVTASFGSRPCFCESPPDAKLLKRWAQFLETTQPINSEKTKHIICCNFIQQKHLKKFF